ncbi:MAG: hypothetical protein WD382_04330 [Halofilum sp. (in: g-proteobacteria)]
MAILGGVSAVMGTIVLGYAIAEGHPALELVEPTDNGEPSA